MKVTHFSAASAGTGGAEAAFRIHGECLKRGVDSTFWVADPFATGVNVRPLTRPFGLLGRLVHRLERRVDHALLRQEAARLKCQVSTGLFGHNLARVVRRERPQLAHLHFIGAGAVRLSSLAGLACPVVWRLTDMWPFCGVEQYTDDVSRYIGGYRQDNRPEGLEGIDVGRWAWANKCRAYARIKRLVVVTPSRWLADCARSSRLFREREVRVIHTGCDTRVFSPRDPAACRQVLDLPGDSLVLAAGATCLANRWKGTDLLVETINRLAGLPLPGKLQLLLFGDDAGDIKRQVHCETHCLGGVKDKRLLAATYGAADVFLAPSRMENLANTVLEAMACGTPCAAFRIGGMPDVIEHGVNGCLAAPFATDELAAGIHAILINRSLERRAAARRKIENGFTVEEQGRQYLELYTSLLEGAVA